MSGISLLVELDLVLTVLVLKDKFWDDLTVVFSDLMKIKMS